MSVIEYKQLTQREHVLLRPETYIGTTSMIEEDLFVADNINDVNSIKIIKKTVKYSPGFIKIFDEVLVNATDHFIRTGKVKNIHIYLNKKENFIQIINDGPSIPIKRNTEGVWIPEMIFLNFLSGSNFDDTKERFTGGRNGIGIKATATFSKEFDIDISDIKSRYYQKAKNNLLNISNPVVKKIKDKQEYVNIKYWPDLEKFNMTEIDDDSISIILRRILESCVYCGKKVNIYFNDVLVNVKTSMEYFKILSKSENIYCDVLGNEWEVFVSKSSSEQFEHSSIVNGISTYNGGTHINWASMTISKLLLEFFPKKYKINWNEIKNNLFIFMVCKIANPTFNSQSKDQLTNYIGKDVLKESAFSAKFIKSLYSSDIVKSIIEKIEFKEKMELSKMQSQKKVKVEKLVDANNKNRSLCELHIFEGDCLEENTNVRIIRDDKILDSKIKNIQIDDMVITHNNTISNISAISKKIKKKSIIKIKGDDIVCSKEHKWFIYDVDKNEFYFEKTININKEKHKLVKNYLAFTDNLLKIEKIIDTSIYLIIGEIVETNYDHKFAVYNNEYNKFEMKNISEIDIDNHYLVNSFKF